MAWSLIKTALFWMAIVKQLVDYTQSAVIRILSSKAPTLGGGSSIGPGMTFGYRAGLHLAGKSA
jgi:hypothetical protein